MSVVDAHQTTLELQLLDAASSRNDSLSDLEQLLLHLGNELGVGFQRGRDITVPHCRCDRLEVPTSNDHRRDVAAATGTPSSAVSRRLSEDLAHGLSRLILHVREYMTVEVKRDANLGMPETL